VRERSLLTACAAALVCFTNAGDARVVELEVMSAVGLRQVLVELGPAFERATGHHLVMTFDSGAMIVRRVERETADVLFIPHEAALQLVAAGKALAGSITPIASSRAGVAVRAGAPQPDISSADALRRTLLAARSIARPDPALGGSSGLHIQKVLERLDIAETIASRTVLSSHPDREDEMPASRLASGQADIALHQIQELLAVPGVVVIGPLPGELDGRFLFSAVVVRETVHQQAGKDLIAFLTAPAARETIRKRGMEPS
jgi:molybdate transport system substrate-binding protein